MNVAWHSPPNTNHKYTFRDNIWGNKYTYMYIKGFGMDGAGWEVPRIELSAHGPTKPSSYYCSKNYFVWVTHNVTVVFKSWNIILVSHHIHRTEICRILPSVRRELRNMTEGDRAASRPLCQSPVNVIVIPLINMLKTVSHLPSVRRELRNMTEGDRAASRPLCQSPVNVIVIPLINMLKTVSHCSPASWKKPFNTLVMLVDFLSSGWTRKNASDWRSRETVNEGLM